MNAMDPSTGMIRRPLEALGTSVAWFQEETARRGLRLHPGCAFAAALARLERFRADVLVDDTVRAASTEEVYQLFAEVKGADFLTKVLHRGVLAGLHIPADRWRLLLSGDPLVTRPGKNSTERNKTWETVIACTAATFASDVRFEEPDILCTFAGRTFAVPAKIVYSTGKLADNVEGAFRQANGKADAVLAFVNVVQLWLHVDELRLSSLREYVHNDVAVDAMRGAVTRWCSRWDLERLAAKLRGRAEQPVGVAYFVPMLVDLAGAPRPFFYTHMPLTWGQSGPDYAFAKAFLGACNTVLGFEGEVA